MDYNYFFFLRRRDYNYLKKMMVIQKDISKNIGIATPTRLNKNPRGRAGFNPIFCSFIQDVPDK